MTVQHQHQQLRRQVPANAMAVQQQQQLRRQEFANAMAVQQQELLRRQGPANAMAVQQQLRRQEFANAMALQQQQQPRRQEQASPGLSKIMQPQSIKKRPSPGALDLSSRPRQPAVTNTHHVVEPPPPKRMRPTPAPLEVPVPPVRPQCPAPAMPQPQPVAPQQSPRISPRSQPVAPSSRPVAESPTDDMDDDDFVKSLETYVLESPRGEDTGMIQEEAGNDDDKIATLAEPEMASEEGHPIIQEEAGNNDDDDDDDDGIMSWAGGLDAELERLSEPEMASDGGQSMIQEGAGTRLMEAELEEVPAVKEPGGKIQEEGQDHHQQASSLEGFVADERGDDVIAQDAWNDFGDPFDGAGDIDYSLPLSAYDIQF